MVTVDAEAFERLVRAELRTRDAAKRARLMDQVAYAAADSAFVAAVMAAAGLEVPDHAEKAVAKARRARKTNEDAAFGDGKAS